MDIKKHINLSGFSNYHTGGPADYFAEVKSVNDIKQALDWARENNALFFILGAGTNVLFPDDGYRGLIIKIGLDNFKIDGTKIIAGAGTMTSDLVQASIENELTGLDWAGGLPGAIGGAARGNAGCFGSEMKDIVAEVSVVDESGEIKKFSNPECGFGYRHSRFKSEKFIITEAVLNLRRDLSKDKLSEIVLDHINYRKERQPLEYPNCGSVFKNVSIEKAPAWVRDKFNDVVKTDPFPVIPAAALIHEAGLKGHAIGGARVSEKHPNFIINFNNAISKDIADLIAFVKKEVELKFEVNLVPEVEIVQS